MPERSTAKVAEIDRHTVVSATRAAVSAYCAIPDPARQAECILLNAAIVLNTVVITCANDEGTADDL